MINDNVKIKINHYADMVYNLVKVIVSGFGLWLTYKIVHGAVTLYQYVTSLY